MRLQYLISRVFEERQYKCSCLKQMHESLKDCSERTLAVEVDYIPHVSVQQWKIQEEWRKWTNSPEEWYAEQKNQTQIAVPTQVDQISPSTSRKCDYCVHNACIAGSFLRGILSASIRAMTTSKIQALVLQNHGHEHDLCHGYLDQNWYIHSSTLVCTLPSSSLLSLSLTCTLISSNSCCLKWLLREMRM